MNTTVDQSLPEQIGRYRILGRLGTGGMGTVYRAHDPHLDRIVALKVPHLDGPVEQRAERVQRFQREARAAARILHPHVCPIFDVGEHDGTAFVVMAFVEGQSLAELLTQRGPFTEREAVRLIRQVLDALAAVHEQGVIHRDVKPSNILIDAAGRAVLTDFGLARPEEPGTTLTSEGVVVGTPAYMAPEQAAGQADQVGPWTDLYAVGVVLYELLTGKLPFMGPLAVVLGAVLRDEPPSPRVYRPGLSPELEAVVLRALRKNPRQRFVAARDFSAALPGPEVNEPALKDSATAVLPVQPQPASPVPRRTWLLRRLGWLAGAVVVAAGGLVSALLVLVAYMMNRDAGWIASTALVGIWSSVTVVPLVLLGLLVWTLVELAYTPEGLWMSARKGWTWYVRAAASNGVPLDLPDELGETALMQAADAGQTEVVKVLLLEGVDTNAVSSLGQTAVEIAYTRGRADIVTLLQKGARPTRPRRGGPGRRPSARRWLVVSMFLGAALVAAYNWGYDPWPAEITFNEVQKFVQARQVKSAAVTGPLIRVETTASRRFWAEAPGDRNGKQPNLIALLKAIDPNLNIRTDPVDRPPSNWGLALLLGIPTGLGVLLAWPIGARFWFPVLRSPRRA
jgi:hypothetical protein